MWKCRIPKINVFPTCTWVKEERVEYRRKHLKCFPRARGLKDEKRQKFSEYLVLPTCSWVKGGHSAFQAFPALCFPRVRGLMHLVLVWAALVVAVFTFARVKTTVIS